MKKLFIDHFFTIITAVSGTVTILDAIPRYTTLFVFFFGVGIGYYICHLLHYYNRRNKEKALNEKDLNEERAFLEGLCGKDD